MLRFAVDLKIEAGVQGTRSVPQKQGLSGQMTPFEKILKFCSETIHDDTNSRSVFKFYGNRFLLSGWNDALFWWQKSLQSVIFFCRCFVSIWRRATKVCRGACHVTLHLRVKFCPNRLWF